MPKKLILIVLLGLLVAATAWVIGTPGDDSSRGFEDGHPAARSAQDPHGTGAHASDAEPPWAGEDWGIFQRRVRHALALGWDTLPMGETMVRVGRTFVGTPYVPHTLEAPGPEHLVVDFRELDCVTFVETVFTTARFIRSHGAGALLSRPDAAEARYDSLLTQLRYRGGVLEGYPSRLHYFTDWIDDAEAKGLVKNITRELGGIRTTKPVDFMTTHPEAYRQLKEHRANLDQVRRAEERLSGEARWFIPQDSIGAVASRIRDGDIIAATSTVPGLDVAHTGLAVWVDGTLRLMNAPLVGDSVQISEVPLSERVGRISSQDGILVARPLDMDGGASRGGS